MLLLVLLQLAAAAPPPAAEAAYGVYTPAQVGSYAPGHRLGPLHRGAGRAVRHRRIDCGPYHAEDLRACHGPQLWYAPPRHHDYRQGYRHPGYSSRGYHRQGFF
ncbi:MAG: hypothetical protein AB1429_02265 [Pseudomonadota bacterium]|jgi:hypothetical protein